LVGDAVFGGPVGTIGGAAAGAVIGNQIGKNQDRR
jgi:osmotically inducible lipoprotein OsmB